MSTRDQQQQHKKKNSEGTSSDSPSNATAAASSVAPSHPRLNCVFTLCVFLFGRHAVYLMSNNKVDYVPY